jgi:hypothetical protein
MFPTIAFSDLEIVELPPFLLASTSLLPELFNMLGAVAQRRAVRHRAARQAVKSLAFAVGNDWLERKQADGLQCSTLRAA